MLPIVVPVAVVATSCLSCPLCFPLSCRSSRSWGGAATDSVPAKAMNKMPARFCSFVISPEIAWRPLSFNNSHRSDMPSAGECAPAFIMALVDFRLP